MTRLAAHRGGALLWPENSLRAFRESVALGVDLLELDVHLCADGGVVVIHDAMLDRTTDSTGPVGGRTTAELAHVRIRGRDGVVTDERVPMLQDVLRLVAGSPVGLLVEIKGPSVNVLYERQDGEVRISSGPEYAGLVDRVLALIGQTSMLDRVNVMGFSPNVVTRTRELEPRVPTTFLVEALHVKLVDSPPEDAIAWAAKLGASDAGLQHTLATPAVMAAARRAGVRVGVWTVNDERLMRRLIDLGVDVLTSDRPDLARRALGR